MTPNAKGQLIDSMNLTGPQADITGQVKDFTDKVKQFQSTLQRVKNDTQNKSLVKTID